MKRNAKTVIAGLVALAMSQAAFAKDIKVAVVGAMSGPVAQWGDMEFNGARQAIKDINAQGGIKGDKLVGVEYDDACDPKQAVAVANKIVNDGIQYVIGWTPRRGRPPLNTSWKPSNRSVLLSFMISSSTVKA